MPNPKHSILQSTYDESEECSIVETSQPLLLSTWASQYAIGPSAMELHMTFSPSWRSDIMTSTDGAYGCPDGNGGVVSGLLPAAANRKAGQIYVDIAPLSSTRSSYGPCLPTRLLRFPGSTTLCSSLASRCWTARSTKS